MHLAALATTAFHGGGPAFWPIFPFFIFIPLFWIALFVVLGIVFGRRRRRAWAAYGHGGFGPGFGGPGFGGMAAWQAARSAESVLAQRFANGDIDEQEYRARLEVLRASYPAGPEPR